VAPNRRHARLHRGSLENSVEQIGIQVLDLGTQSGDRIGLSLPVFHRAHDFEFATNHDDDAGLT